MAINPAPAIAFFMIGTVVAFLGAMIYNAVWWGLLGAIGSGLLFIGILIAFFGVLVFLILPMAGYERRPA